MIELNTRGETGEDYIKITIYAEFQFEKDYLEGVAYTHSFNIFKYEKTVKEVIEALEGTIKKLKIPIFDESQFIRFMDQEEFDQKYKNENEEDCMHDSY